MRRALAVPPHRPLDRRSGRATGRRVKAAGSLTTPRKLRSAGMQAGTRSQAARQTALARLSPTMCCCPPQRCGRGRSGSSNRAGGGAQGKRAHKGGKGGGRASGIGAVGRAAGGAGSVGAAGRAGGLLLQQAAARRDPASLDKPWPAKRASHSCSSVPVVELCVYPMLPPPLA